MEIPNSGSLCLDSKSNFQEENQNETPRSDEVSTLPCQLWPEENGHVPKGCSFGSSRASQCRAPRVEREWGGRSGA